MAAGPSEIREPFLLVTFLHADELTFMPLFGEVLADQLVGFGALSLIDE
jgi:hypothetical protein